MPVPDAGSVPGHRVFHGLPVERICSFGQGGGKPDVRDESGLAYPHRPEMNTRLHPWISG